jgi:uncharacterized membrane protein
MMICVSVMLAVFLGWPLAFGGGEATVLQPTRAEARSPAVTVAAPAAAAVAKAEEPATPKAESCYKRYQREVRQCTGGASAACRLQSADHWDMCEATGFWPE